MYIVVPTSKTTQGKEYIDLPMGFIDRAIAVRIIEARVPIRGAEVGIFCFYDGTGKFPCHKTKRKALQSMRKWSGIGREAHKKI